MWNREKRGGLFFLSLRFPEHRWKTVDKGECQREKVIAMGVNLLGSASNMANHCPGMESV